MFEGLNKVNSYYYGPSETTKVFTSEPYFKVGPGPVAPYMRKMFNDPEQVIQSTVFPPEPISTEAFRKLTVEQQAKSCPAVVSTQLDALREKAQDLVVKRAQAALQTADAAKASAEKDTKTPERRAKLLESIAADRKDAEKRIADAATIADTHLTEAKAKYARWVYGVDARPVKLKAVTGTDPALSAPARHRLLEEKRQDLAEAESRRDAGLGSGSGIEAKRADALRADLLAMEADLARDAKEFVDELKTDLTGEKINETAAETQGAFMDRVTMWFLVVSGGCLLAGLFTRVACLAAAGFLVMTYLTHPPFPWFVAPPGTEGNPLFVNKNSIECLALLALACMPTGRWLGLDALVLRPFLRYDSSRV